jgi:hypothetical protein
MILSERCAEIRESGVAEFEKHRIELILLGCFENLFVFEEINKIYYRTIIKHQAWYYLAVLVLFFLVVLANYAIAEFISYCENSPCFN